MRVDLSAGAIQPSESRTDKSSTRTSGPVDRSSQAQTDSANLLTDRIRVRALRPETEAENRARQQRVEDLRQKVARREYAVDSNQLAGAMLSEGAVRLR